jgi:nucleoside-diphosphate-sugar epimerase
VTINEMVDIVEKIAGITVARNHDLTAPQGVRGRSSDNTEMIRRYGWAPSITLTDGLERTYRWVYDEVKKSLAG